MKCFSFSPKRIFSISPKAIISKSTEEESLTSALKALGSVHIFSFKELREATQGFKSSYKIGEGGFGSVYKGQLHDGRVVAVKVLLAESRQGNKEFIAEITAMSNITHENLVKLLGGCIEGNNRILVYEYMQNHSLAQTLYGGEHRRIKLDWERRREICLSVAKGITYLHEEVKPHIVHRDIKASNILLDHDFIPRVSDFGLSKLFPDNISHISTRVAGTLGHLAPEYAVTGHLTRKSDVYSFGVLVLEILSGRSAVDFDMELGEYFLVEKAWDMYKAGEILHLMDPTLNENFPETEVILFMKVGLVCVQETTRLRPKMSEAMKMMCDERDMNDIEILQPGVISDMMRMKIANRESSGSPPSKITSSRSSTQSPTETLSESIQK